MDIAAKQIIKLRKKMGLTQKAFSEEIGFSRSYIRDIELKKAKPSRSVLEAIKKSFGISIDSILFGDNVRDRVKSFFEVFEKTLNSIGTNSQKKKSKEITIYDHLQGINEITQFEISYYIYKILSLSRERDLETRTLKLPFGENFIIELPNEYHAFLGNLSSFNKFAGDIIAHSISTCKTKYYSPSYSDLGWPESKKILVVKGNQFFYEPLNKYYNPKELFIDPFAGEHWLIPSWPHTSKWKVKELIEEYFSEIEPIEPSKEIGEINSEIKLSNIERSVVNVLRAIDSESIKDFYGLLSLKGNRLSKKKKDNIKNDIKNLKNAAK